jgi:hypothetical protein
MPTVLYINGYRFFFYSQEGNEPMHIHVTKSEANGKLWLEPVIKVAYFINFTVRQQREIMQIIENNYPLLKRKWHEYFSK